MVIKINRNDVIKEHGSPRSKNNEQKIDLIDMGIIGEFTQGQYVILPKGMKILNGIYEALQTYVVKPLNFEEIVLPKMAPVDTFKKASLVDFPDGKQRQSSFPWSWDQYLLTVQPFGETEGVKETYILDPLQCTVFYQFFEGKTIDVSNNPLKWYDRSGPTYRNESLDSLFPGVKQREFHRAEFVFLGTQEQVIHTRERALEQIESLCQSLELDYRIVVGGSCHRLEDHEVREPTSLDDIPVKDIEIYCPGYGYLEVSGNAIMGNVLTSRFSIGGSNGEELWSGCSGVGLNRMMYALISNHGTEP
jgi:seryl-tRNA synthetase